MLNLPFLTRPSSLMRRCNDNRNEGMMDVRFTVERLLRRGLCYRLILAAAIIAVVAISGGSYVFLQDPVFEDPGYLGF